MRTEKPTGILTPTDICRIFGISKATLLRWETAGKISDVPRDASGNRVYSSAHVKQIAQSELPKLKEQYTIAARSENSQHMQQIHHKLQECKFLSGQISGLHEMHQWGLSEQRIRQLLEWLLQVSNPREEFFHQSLDLLAHAARKLVAPPER